MRINPAHAIDFYKAGHPFQYPKGTNLVYANWTARNAKHASVSKQYDNTVVWFGLQYAIKSFLIDMWNDGFFKQPKELVISRYKRRMDTALGKDSVSTDHIAALHELGYLPIQIKALPEGTSVPIGVPMMTIVNTRPEFFWLTNYLESALSALLWKGTTSATTAREYRRVLNKFAKDTGSAVEFADWQAHDFSFRGMSGFQDAVLSGAAHLTSFTGTDTVLAIDMVEDYYLADADKELVGGSVPATEHAVMCMGSKEAEIETFRRLLVEQYPNGILSVVSDTWDFWKVVTEYMVELKSVVLERNGKLVIRPDSGDPVKIIVGDTDAEKGSPAYKGAVECLWETFGGTTTETGHKLLDSHIGLIYGDSITIERAEAILSGLAAKGFASGNVVFGVGSFTYEHVTRDTFGFAMKSTYGEVEGVGRDIFKDPATDNGTKRSAKGLLKVVDCGGKLQLVQGCTKEQEATGELEVVFKDGVLVTETSLASIRKKVAYSV